MWYLVNLPGNKLKIAVKTERNSIAADCLNKVSSNCSRDGRFATWTLRSASVHWWRSSENRDVVAKMSYHNHHRLDKWQWWVNSWMRLWSRLSSSEINSLEANVMPTSASLSQNKKLQANLKVMSKVLVAAKSNCAIKTTFASLAHDKPLLKNRLRSHVAVCGERNSF